MEKIRPVFKKLLIAAIVVYVIGTCVIMAELYYKVGNIEHALAHMPGAKCSHK
ncbi:MAG: hypothetical protein KKI13_01840 [Candidatus Omnitrophica bacterium]|nr:hypothetical protein [Candidatus Omnitrophota bacterium]MCG2705569.1 hypothetical protein [Candidatus Omnitrophota bacterium]